MPQGKTFNKETILQSLKPYFLMGLTIKEACDESHVCDENTIYNWCKNDVNIEAQIVAWQNHNTLNANMVITDAIQSKDKDMAKWWLEKRKNKYFSSRVENETTLNVSPVDKVNKLLDELSAETPTSDTENSQDIV